MLASGHMPYSVYDSLYKFYIKDYTGESFLAHPEVLIYNEFRHTRKDLTYYLALASLRSYAEYKANGIVTLDLIKAPVHPHSYLENIELMPVKDGLIHFIYEEMPEKAEMH